jgi:hypothetical protein
VSDPRFGEGIPLDGFILEMLATAPQMCATDAQLLLRDRYDQTYGIFNHDLGDPDRPWALIGMHWAEDCSTGSYLYERIEAFEDKKIYARFGLSLTEFLALPRDVTDHLFRIANKKQSVENKITGEVLNELQGKT